MTKVKTATGKEFDSDYFVALQDPPMMFVRVLNQDERTLQEVFSDPNETSCLSSGDRVAFGYTTLHSIFNEGDAFKVTLLK